jgi:WD40 repeat protein
MKVDLAWGDRVTTKDDDPTQVYSVSLSPDKEHLVLGVANRVFVYSQKKGTIVNSLRGHREQITCIRYSLCGERFASASDDHNVIVWSNNGTGLLKYSHGTPVTTLAFCPVSYKLASGAETDIAIWSSAQSNVVKVKVSSRCLCMEWSPDGSYLVTGHADGSVVIRNQKGAEVHTIKRGGAVWAIAFNPQPYFEVCSHISFSLS